MTTKPDETKPEQTRSEWSLKITRADNGYILDDSINPILVIEDDKENALRCHENLLWEVMAFFNFAGSKHDLERIRIVRKKNKL